MIRNPIRKVLSSMRRNQVQCLLMGGQACVLYGAAEFSRDTDLAILAEPANLHRLQTTLDDLRAQCIAVPPFQAEFLHRGHGIHFRCRHPDVMGMRIDIMSVMRGVDPFPDLWQRRTTIEAVEGDCFELLSLPDLVRAKKTQRDKDWLMLRRLMEAHYFERRENPSADEVAFWLRELRTADILIGVADKFRETAQKIAPIRPLLEPALSGDYSAVSARLVEEERREKEADRIYWLPLKHELELLRRQQTGGE